MPYLGYYAVLPSIIIFGCLLVFIALPVFRRADSPPTFKLKRDVSLDGLRGFLAIAVVMQHQEMSVHSRLTGTGGLPPSSYYTIYGQAGVAIFFMITGYLFWGKMLRDNGKVNWVSLYISRIFRIAPMYYLLMASSIVIVLVESRFSFYVPPIVIVKSCLKIILSGMYLLTNLNGSSIFRDLVGPTWTLHYEWLFYASLIVSGQLCRFWLGSWMPLIALLFLSIWMYFNIPAVANVSNAICILQFLIGMTIAGVKRSFPSWNLKELFGSSAMLSIILVVFLVFDNAVQTAPVLLLGFFFALSAYGYTLFGLLESKPARRLGDISYGIYILQGPVSWIAGVVDPGSERSLQAHWLHSTCSLLFLVIIAAIAHVFIERPGIEAGKRLILWLNRQYPGTSVAGQNY